MEKPKISVLLCVYNPDKKQLYEAVKSILGQTYANWEMILYDDGSEEPCKEWIYQMSYLDSRIRYVRNENHHSLAYGLNESLKLAKGKFIARMDGDDISRPTRFEEQIQFLEENEVFLWVGSNIALIDEKGEHWGERQYATIPKEKDFLKFSPYAHPTIMIHREELMNYGGYNTEKSPYRSEDYELFMRLHAAGEQGYNLQEVLLDYRESKEGYKKRTLKFQFQEMLVRWEGFRKLRILDPITLIYVIKPLLVWMIPNEVIYALKRM